VDDSGSELSPLDSPLRFSVVDQRYLSHSI